jgi:hypothetical protein
VISRRMFITSLATFAVPVTAGAQTAGNVRRVGIIHLSGHHQVVVDGLRQGLRELRLEEGKHVVLEVREIKGDLRTVGEAARELERGKVATSVVKKSAPAIAPQWARRKVRHEDGRSGAGGSPLALSTLATVLLATAWPRFFSAPWMGV